MLTIMDVVVDEDWNNTVARIPIMRPATGFDKTSLSENVELAAFPTNSNEIYQLMWYYAQFCIAKLWL